MKIYKLKSSNCSGCYVAVETERERTYGHGKPGCPSDEGMCWAIESVPDTIQDKDGNEYRPILLPLYRLEATTDEA